MSSLPHLPDVYWSHSLLRAVENEPEELIGSALEEYKHFQDSAFQAFDVTFAAAVDLRAEFSSLIEYLNQLPRDVWPRLHKDRLLQRIVSQTVAPRLRPGLLNISLGQQFSRIFLKRRKVLCALYRLKCVVTGEMQGFESDEPKEFSLKVFSSLLPVRELNRTRRGAPLLSGRTTCISRLCDPVHFSFRFNDISSDFPGGVLALVVACSHPEVEPLVISNVAVKVMRKQFRFTSD